MKQSLFAIVLMMVLAACGADADGMAGIESTAEAENDAGVAVAYDSLEPGGMSGLAYQPEITVGFTGTVSGAVEAEIEAYGYFMCYSMDLSVGAENTMANNVMLRVPKDSEAGTYEFVADYLASDGPSAVYVTADGSTYNQDVSGSITYDAMPTQAGESASGSYSFSASNADGETVDVSGTFDFAVQTNAFVNCT